MVTGAPPTERTYTEVHSVPLSESRDVCGILESGTRSNYEEWRRPFKDFVGTALALSLMHKFVGRINSHIPSVLVDLWGDTHCSPLDLLYSWIRYVGRFRCNIAVALFVH